MDGRIELRFQDIGILPQLELLDDGFVIERNQILTLAPQQYFR
jgi:hypothetical protein